MKPNEYREIEEFANGLPVTQLKYSEICDLLSDYYRDLFIEISSKSKTLQERPKTNKIPKESEIEVSEYSQFTDDEIENIPFSQFSSAFESPNSKKAKSDDKEPKKTSPRKHGTPWEEPEELAIIEGLKKYGLGGWELIFKKYSDTFMINKRTVNDIKMKWSRMKNSPKYQEFAECLPQPSKVAKKQIEGQSSIMSFFKKK